MPPYPQFGFAGSGVGHRFTDGCGADVGGGGGGGVVRVDSVGVEADVVAVVADVGDALAVVRAVTTGRVVSTVVTGLRTGSGEPPCGSCTPDPSEPVVPPLEHKCPFGWVPGSAGYWSSGHSSEMT